jgi:hypothetical protein
MIRPRVFAFTLLLAVPLLAPAYEINPNSHQAGNVKRSLKTEYRQYLARLTKPTHEELTRLALQCAESSEKLDWCDVEPLTPSNTTRRFSLEAATHGTRWNDDPNNFFRVNNEFIWFYWLKAAAVKNPITDENPLEYRSHYGDLQFLHGMGSSATSPFNTRDNVLEWSRFAYDVAAGKIPPDATLRELAPRYAFARFFTQTSKGQWTVRKLFTNVGDVLCKPTCAADIAASDEEVAALAIGALLHTVQDSLSDSHVDRVSEDGKSRVAAWLDYKQQDSHCHGKADKNVGWLEKKEYKTKPAIEWGAWIARNAMMQVRWEDIQANLTDRMFTLAKDYRASDAGKFSKACPAQLYSKEGQVACGMLICRKPPMRRPACLT